MATTFIAAITCDPKSAKATAASINTPAEEAITSIIARFGWTIMTHAHPADLTPGAEGLGRHEFPNSEIPGVDLNYVLSLATSTDSPIRILMPSDKEGALIALGLLYCAVVPAKALKKARGKDAPLRHVICVFKHAPESAQLVEALFKLRPVLADGRRDSLFIEATLPQIKNKRLADFRERIRTLRSLGEKPAAATFVTGHNTDSKDPRTFPLVRSISICGLPEELLAEINKYPRPADPLVACFAANSSKRLNKIIDDPDYWANQPIHVERQNRAVGRPLFEHHYQHLPRVKDDSRHVAELRKSLAGLLNAYPDASSFLLACGLAVKRSEEILHLRTVQRRVWKTTKQLAGLLASRLPLLHGDHSERSERTENAEGPKPPGAPQPCAFKTIKKFSAAAGAAALMAALTGCANISGLIGAQSEYSCSKANDGLPCASLSEVNDAHEAGLLPHQRSEGRISKLYERSEVENGRQETATDAPAPEAEKPESRRALEPVFADSGTTNVKAEATVEAETPKALTPQEAFEARLCRSYLTQC